MRRRGPGELNYASYGVGSGPHLATELFQAKTGVKMVHVPYGGGGPAAVGAMTNQVQALFSSVLPVLGMIRGGTLKAIAIASDRRSELLPEVPTFAGERARLPHRHLVRSARARQDAARRSSMPCTARPSAVLQDQGARAKIVEQGAEVIANSPAEFRAFIKDETGAVGGRDSRLEHRARLTAAQSTPGRS